MTIYYYQNVNGRLFILEKILIVALHLFARDGYETVYVSRIAGELDMIKGALYRHNKRKRDIFDCTVQRMEQQMELSCILVAICAC